MMISAVIVDDENHSIEMIEDLIEKYFPKIIAVSKAKNIKEAISTIEQHKPNLLFLDIELKDGSGFEIREATSHLDYKLIFVTAYSQYAIKAFKANAIEYVLKPIQEDDFILAVQKAINSIEQNRQSIIPEKIHFFTHDGHFYIEPNEILFLKADSNYTTVFLNDNKQLMLSKTIKEVSDKLPKNIFLRVHKSFIINTSFITNFINGDGGTIILKKNVEIPVSRTKKNEVLKLLNSTSKSS